MQTLSASTPQAWECFGISLSLFEVVSPARVVEQRVERKRSDGNVTRSTARKRVDAPVSAEAFSC